MDWMTRDLHLFSTSIVVILCVQNTDAACYLGRGYVAGAVRRGSAAIALQVVLM